MKLEEYLAKELKITEEEATKIAEALHSYKNLYGHHNKYKNSKNKDVAELYLSNDCELDKIHCNCCENHCKLSAPNCQHGQNIRAKIMKSNK